MTRTYEIHRRRVARRQYACQATLQGRGSTVSLSLLIRPKKPTPTARGCSGPSQGRARRRQPRPAPAGPPHLRDSGRTMRSSASSRTACSFSGLYHVFSTTRLMCRLVGSIPSCRCPCRLTVPIGGRRSGTWLSASGGSVAHSASLAQLEPYFAQRLALELGVVVPQHKDLRGAGQGAFSSTLPCYSSPAGQFSCAGDRARRRPPSRLRPVVIGGCRPRLAARRGSWRSSPRRRCTTGPSAGNCTIGSSAARPAATTSSISSTPTPRSSRAACPIRLTDAGGGRQP